MKIVLISFVMAAAATVACFGQAQLRPATRSASTSTSSIDPALEEPIKSRGLAKVGTRYLLDTDTYLSEDLRAYRKARFAIEENNRKRAQIENEIKTARANIAQQYRKYRDLNDQLAQTSETKVQNRLAGQINSLSTKIKEAEQAKSDKEKQVTQLSDPRDDYVTLVLALAEKMEATSKRYAELASDLEVKAALAKINDTARPKLALGPSAQFAEQLPLVRKQREMINSSAIQCTMEGGVPRINVTLNGTVTERMVVDSGASLVLLTWDLAKRLGLNPDASDEIVKIEDASGKVTEAKKLRLKSVRVGQFTVQDVECAVQPSSVPNTTCLLGGTFLRNFVYRMDLKAGELHLSQIGGKANGADTIIGKPSADVPATGPANGTKAGGKPLTPVAGETTPDDAPPTVPTGICKIVNKTGGLCIGIPQGSREPGKAAILWESVAAPDQRWTALIVDEKYIRFMNQDTSMCLAVGEGEKAPGTPVVQSNWRNTDEQQWTAELVSGKYFKIANKKSGLYLTRKERGGAITLETWQKLDSQLWRLDTVGN